MERLRYNAALRDARFSELFLYAFQILFQADLLLVSLCRFFPT